MAYRALFSAVPPRLVERGDDRGTFALPAAYRGDRGRDVRHAGAAARRRERAAKGMSDDELAKALAYEIGIFGGRSSPDGISLTYQAAGLKILISWEIGNTHEQPPTFQGRATMAMAREVYRIKDHRTVLSLEEIGRRKQRHGCRGLKSLFKMAWLILFCPYKPDVDKPTYAEPAGPVASSRRASSLSIRLPSISTISKRHPS